MHGMPRERECAMGVICFCSPRDFRELSHGCCKPTPRARTPPSPPPCSRRRFWWTLPLTAAVTLLAMFGHSLGWFDMAVQSWIELALAVPIVLWAGWPFFVRGSQSIVNRSPNMWTLISLGTGAAFVYSTVATVAPQVFPASFMSMGRIGVYFEAAA